MALKVNMSIYLALLSSLLCFLNTSACAHQAIPLITVEENQGNGEAKFVLNPEAIFRIKHLPSPVRVIAAIGDARVGKSTALNFIFHSIMYRGIPASDYENVEEIFKTGKTMAGVTRGVWIWTVKFPTKDGWESVIVLDVEGTDLGDDTVTDKLSMFATLMSSSLLLFMKEHPTNHINEFVYKIARMTDMTFSKDDTKYLPNLMVILRGALNPPQGQSTIDEYVKDSLAKPTLVENQFRKDDITVVNLPFDPTLTTPEYRDKINFLGEKLRDLRYKRISNKSLTGTWEKIKDKTLKFVSRQKNEDDVTGWTMDDLNFMLTKIVVKTDNFFNRRQTIRADDEIDGEELVDFAERIMKVLNEEHRSKGRISHNFYDLFENEICSKTFIDEIKPLLDAKKDEMISSQERDSKISQFKKRCISKQRVDTAMNILDSCRKDDQQCQSSNWDGVNWYIWWIGLFTALALICMLGMRILPLLSDVQLKENITVLNNSEYETIGLRGVEWVWNQEAESLGLSGKETGVVAQEVELLYPWAVTEGYDGYKRVNYLALRLLIWAKKFQRKAGDEMIF